jgi:hypothetical protein
VHVLVFTGSSRLRAAFKLGRQRGLVSGVDFASCAELPRVLKKLDAPTLCYLDVAELGEARLRACLRSIARKENVVYGLIDPGGKIKDVARAFHEGAVDYLGRAALAGGVGVQRLRRVLSFVQGVNPDLLDEAAAKARGVLQASYLPSGSDWQEVVAGREYTFCFMFIELDGKEDMEKKYGVANLSIALASFRNYIEDFVRPFGGRIWIWLSFGGVILFPFDAKTCPALTCGFRLMLSKHLYDVEGSHFPTFLSFRLVLLVGNTVYSEENTGHIVSDTLNGLFHLGQQYARAGNFYITEEVLHFGHPGLRAYFNSAGTFEGRKVLRMRRPLHRPAELDREG